MNKKTLISAIVAVCLLVLLFTGISAAQEHEQDLHNAGILPDSLFYFPKSLGEEIVTFFTFGSANKAERHIYLAEKRLVETKALAEKKAKAELIENTLERYRDSVDKSLQLHQKAKTKKPRPELEEKISERLLNHQEVLLIVYSQIPEQTRRGAQNAIDSSQRGFNQAIESVSKERKEELRKRFGDVSERIAKCGDSICDELEKQNPSLCPKDCEGDVIIIPDSGAPISTAEFLDSPFGIWDTVSGYGITEPDTSSMSDLGVHWEAVPVPPVFPARWQEWESTYNKYKNTGITPVPMIDLVSQRGGGGLSLSPTEYYNAIKSAVSYFNGIDYWMLASEVDNQYNRGYLTVEQYSLYTRLTYKAMKDARPSAKLAAAGTGGTARSYTDNGFFVLVFEELEKLENIEKNPSSYDWSENPYDLTREDFDLVFKKDNYEKYMDIHQFSNFDMQFDDYNFVTRELIDSIKDLLNAYGYDNVALWDTQTGTHNGQPTNPKGLPYQTEAQQANDLLRKYVLSLSLGLDKIFWTTTYEFLWNDDTEEYFSKVGLVYNGLGSDDSGFGAKKLSYYTYKKMIEILEGSDWDSIHTVQESDGVYVYKFANQGKSIWVAWNDNSAEKQITISGIASAQVKITEAVPKYESGKDVEDYNTAFNAETKSASNGGVTVTLGEDPIFVEEI